MPDRQTYPTAFWVPEPPDDESWDHWLRWAVFVMDESDPQRHFAASCLAWFLKSGGLSDKQHAACVRMCERILERYDAGALACQVEEPEEHDEPADPRPDRRSMN